MDFEWDELVDFQEQQETVDLQQDMPNVRLGAGSRLATQADLEQVAQESLIVGKELFRRFEEFVQAVTQDMMAEVQHQPKFWTLVRQLCEKAPQSAESLGTRIIEYVRRGDRPDDVIEEPAAQSSAPVHSIAQSRKHKAENSSYRPPKYTKATGNRSTLETGEKRQSARLAGGKLAKVSNNVDGNAPQDSAKMPCKSTKESKRDSKVAHSAARGDPVDDDNAPQDSAKVPSTSSKDIGCDDSKVNNSISPSDQVDDSALDRANATSSTKEAECDDTKVTRSAIRSVLMRSEGTNTSEGGNQTGLEVDDACMVVYNRALDIIPSTTREESVPPDSRTQVESPKSSKLGELIQSTPAHQTKADPIESPQTEEIYREKIPTSLESIRSSPGLMNAAPENVCAVTDHILEVVRIIHGLSKHQDGLPRPVHVAILQALGDSRQDMLASSDWSSGSMWMDILEAGSVEGQKVTILRMLEYMGAWDGTILRFDWCRKVVRSTRRRINPWAVRVRLLTF